MALEKLVNARSVAVVGASPTNGVTRNIFAWANAMHSETKYWPVNPKYREVSGFDAYPALEDLPHAPDAIAMAVGGKSLPDLVESAISFEPGGLVVYSDLRQVDDGVRQNLTARIRNKNIALVGSNCMGAISFLGGTAYYSGDVNSLLLEPGNVGLISQSGSALIGMLSAAPRLRFTSVFSVGNEDVTTTADYISYLANDGRTKVVGCFLETIRDPEGFRRAAASAANSGTAIVALTVGKSPKARENAATHSGALAPDAAVMSAFLADCGVIEVLSFEAFIETLVAFQSTRLPRGNAVGMVHVSGGEASLQLDFGHRNDLVFPLLKAQSIKEMRSAAPWLSAADNPLDTWGAVSYQQSYPPSLAALSGDAGIDVIVANQDIAQHIWDVGPHVTRKIAEAMVASAATHDKPMFMISNTSLGFDDETLDLLAKEHIPLLAGVDAGYTALGNWTRFWTSARPLAAPPRSSDVRGKVRPIGHGFGALDEVRSLELLNSYGLSTPKLIEVPDEKGALQAAREIGYPVVLKGVGESLLHKTEVGAVVTGIRNEEQLRASIDRINSGAAGGAVTSYLVVQQVERHREMMLGAHRDSQLGVVVLVGIGGIMAEIISDVKLAVPPISHKRAAEMVAGLRGVKWLDQWRNLKPADRRALVEAIVAFSIAVEDMGDRMVSIDVNPLAVLEGDGGCVMLDALVVLR